MIDAILIFVAIVGGLFGIVMLLCGAIPEDKWAINVGIISLCIAAACLLTEMYVATELDDKPWTREDPYVTHTIMALQDGSEIQGNLRHRRYGMSGYINEEFMYVYGYKTYSGGMKIQKVSAKNAVVYFDDSVSPNAKWYRETKKFWWSESERYTCDIFIPTGSLQAEMVIDLQ